MNILILPHHPTWGDYLAKGFYSLGLMDITVNPATPKDFDLDLSPYDLIIASITFVEAGKLIDLQNVLLIDHNRWSLDHRLPTTHRPIIIVDERSSLEGGMLCQPKKGIHHIPNGIDLNFWRPSVTSRFGFISCADIWNKARYDQKRIDLLKEMQKFKEIPLVGYDIPAVEKDGVRNFYWKSKVFVLSYSLGLAPKEAMACGLPVVTLLHPRNKKLISLHPILNSLAFKKIEDAVVCLEELSTDKDFYTYCSNKCLELVYKKWSAFKMAKAYLKIIENYKLGV